MPLNYPQLLQKSQKIKAREESFGIGAGIQVSEFCLTVPSDKMTGVDVAIKTKASFFAD